MLNEENQIDQVRVSIAAVLDYVTRIITDIPGVVGSHSRVLRNLKISSGGEYLAPSEKIDPANVSLEIDIALTLDSQSNFGEVALTVQRKVFHMVREELALPVEKVNVEIGRIDWSAEKNERRR